MTLRDINPNLGNQRVRERELRDRERGDRELADAQEPDPELRNTDDSARKLADRDDAAGNDWSAIGAKPERDVYQGQATNAHW
jgi:hypothetical protein